MRKFVRECALPLAATALLPLLSWLDRPNWGPHEMGAMGAVLPMTGFAAVICALFALRRRRWLRLAALVLLVLACTLCSCWIEPLGYCPECGC